MSAAGTQSGASRNGAGAAVAPGAGPSDERSSARPDGRRSLRSRLGRALAAPLTSRIPPADLDERDPTTSASRYPGLWLLASLWFRGEVRGLGNIPEHGPGPARRQPLGRQPHAGHDGLHARLQRVLRRRAALPPARPQPRALDARASASCASSAPSPRRPPTPRRRCARGAAVLVYPGGDYEVHRPSWERAPRRLRRAPRLRAARARAGRADRARRRRSAARRPRSSSAAASALARAARPRPRAAPEGAADLARAAVGPERRRLPRPPPAAGQDHRRGAAADPPARRVRPRARRRRGLRARRARSCRRRSTRSPPSGACR